MHFYLFLKHRDTEDAEDHEGGLGMEKPSVFLRVLCISVLRGGKVHDRL